MWPFSQKKNLGSLPAITDESHTWTLAEGSYGGAPLIVRLSDTAQAWCGHPDLPIKLGFAVPLNSPSAGGLPDPAENELLGYVEDIIRGHVAASTIGVHALVLTTGDMKEFVFYVPLGVDIKSLHEAIQAEVTTHEVQCMAVKETKWDSFKNFSPG